MRVRARRKRERQRLRTVVFVVLRMGCNVVQVVCFGFWFRVSVMWCVLGFRVLGLGYVVQDIEKEKSE